MENLLTWYFESVTFPDTQLYRVRSVQNMMDGGGASSAQSLTAFSEQYVSVRNTNRLSRRFRENEIVRCAVRDFRDANGRDNDDGAAEKQTQRPPARVLVAVGRAEVVGGDGYSTRETSSTATGAIIMITRVTIAKIIRAYTHC